MARVATVKSTPAPERLHGHLEPTPDGSVYVNPAAMQWKPSQFEGIEIKVVKNTLARKAMEALPASKGYAELFGALHGPTAILFAEAGNAPAKVLKEFRTGPMERPKLKAAQILRSKENSSFKRKTL